MFLALPTDSGSCNADKPEAASDEIGLTVNAIFHLYPPPEPPSKRLTTAGGSFSLPSKLP